jgi:hypothetical protein
LFLADIELTLRFFIRHEDETHHSFFSDKDTHELIGIFIIFNKILQLVLMDNIAIDKILKMGCVDAPGEFELFAIYDGEAEVYISERTDSDKDWIFAYVALQHALRYLSDIIPADVEIVLQSG